MAKAREYHGEAHRTAEWRAWHSMRQRCENPKHERYRYYGARGIRVCDRWQTFAHFLADMGRKPSRAHSLDRRDGNDDYTPKNCRWATATEQANNRRAWGRWNTGEGLTVNGVTKFLWEWERDTGISQTQLRDRLRLGWTAARAVTVPVRPRRKKGELING